MEQEQPNPAATAVLEAPPPFEGDDAAPPAKAAPKDAGKDGDGARPGKPKDETAELRDQLQTLRRQLDETSASERYWADQAKAGGKGKNAVPEEDPDADIDVDDLTAGEGDEDTAAPSPDDFVDALSKEGPAAITKELKRLGYVNKAEIADLVKQVARRVVDKERGKLTMDARLATEFPELKDAQSELFQATSAIYREAVALDPSLKKSPAALIIAARQAKAQLAAKAKAKVGGEEDETRRRRIESQNGDRDRGGARFEDDDDDAIGPEQQAVIKMMGVDEKSYREQKARDRAAKGRR